MLEYGAHVTFAGLVGGHAAIGEDEAGHALRGEVVDEVLHPGEVGVALGRDAELMNASAFSLRVAFGNLSRSARLPAHVVVIAEIVLRFAHDLHFGFALKECAIAQGSVGVVEGHRVILPLARSAVRLRIQVSAVALGSGGDVVGEEVPAEGVGVRWAEVGLEADGGG